MTSRAEQFPARPVQMNLEMCPVTQWGRVSQPKSLVSRAYPKGIAPKIIDDLDSKDTKFRKPDTAGVSALIALHRASLSRGSCHAEQEKMTNLFVSHSDARSNMKHVGMKKHEPAEAARWCESSMTARSSLRSFLTSGS